ncbi:hypothetical protein NDA00_28875, partial [Funiculus sociatus GB2-M2]|uniref:hypothetical protein n=1 Tax=Cyanophyceae TaxID=3028117 RepID=UPI001A7ED2BC
ATGISRYAWLLNSERQAPLTTRTVGDIVAKAAIEAGLGYSGSLRVCGTDNALECLTCVFS